tara:strand:- start:172 stop:1044 length:873 start_codon:yes stop_codon:yes gene_type:complete
MSFIKKLKSDNGIVTLKKLEKSMLIRKVDNSQLKMRDSINICFLDTETTGKDTYNDKIIEIGMKCISFDKVNGTIIEIIDTYQGLEDPQVPIDPEATMVNGINDEMVKDKLIEWEKVSSIINKSDLIVAHNAKFDRGFLDRYIDVSKEKVWGCSMSDIDWLQKGFPGRGLEMLSVWHGFYFDSHRGMADVDAMIYLISNDFEDKGNYINELINNSHKNYYLIEISFNYDKAKIELCKSKGYFFNGINKTWCKKIEFNEIEFERDWAAANFYDDYFKGTVEEISLHDRFKR